MFHLKLGPLQSLHINAGWLIKASISLICLQVKNASFWLVSDDKIENNDSSKILITDMKAQTFQGKTLLLNFSIFLVVLLEYAYFDHAELTYTVAIELLQHGEKLSMPELPKLCEAFLEKNLDADNYLEALKLAKALRFAFLRKAVVNFIVKNVKLLKVLKSFEEVSDSVLREVIVKYTVKN